MLIFQFCPVDKIHGTVFTIERPARGRKVLENKKTSRLRKRGMEEIRQAAQKQFGRTGLILLFAEKSAGENPQPRRAQSNRYPDFGLKPHSRLPKLSLGDIGSL
jgi:hypothetical protein